MRYEQQFKPTKHAIRRFRERVINPVLGDANEWNDARIGRVLGALARRGSDGTHHPGDDESIARLVASLDLGVVNQVPVQLIVKKRERIIITCWPREFPGFCLGHLMECAT